MRRRRSLGIAISMSLAMGASALSAATAPTAHDSSASTPRTPISSSARLSPMLRVPRPRADSGAAVWDTLERLEVHQRWAASESTAVVHVRRLEAAPQPDSLELSCTLLYVANGRIKRRLYGDGKAFDALERAIAIRERNVRGPDPLQIWAHVVAGTTFSDADEPSRGVRHGEMAVRMLEASAPIDSASLAQAHLGLALCLAQLGQDEEAKHQFESALTLREAMDGPYGAMLAPMLGEYGFFLAQNNDFDQGRAMLLRAQAIGERAPRYGSQLLEGILSRRSGVEDRLGDVAEALDLAERACELTKRRLGKASVEALRAENIVSNRLQELGDYEGSAALLQDVVPGLAAGTGTSSGSALNVRLALINAWVQIGDTASVAQGLAVARAALARQPELVTANKVYYLQLAADLEHARGHDAVARDTLRVAIQSEWQRRGKTGGKRAILYTHWMKTLRGPGDREPLDEAARDIARLTDSTFVRRTSTWEPLVAARAAAEARVGLHDLAWAHALEAEQLAREGLGYTLQSLPDDHALHLAHHLGEPCDMLVALAEPQRPDDLATAWERIVLWRGVVGHEIARRRLPAEAGADTALAAAHDRWIAAQRRLAQLVVSGAAHPDDPETGELFQSARRDVDGAEHRYEQMASATVSPEDSVSLTRVLARLGPSQALIAFATGSIGPGTETLGAFVATGGERTPRWIAAGPSIEIEGAVRDWVRHLGTPPADAADAARDEATCRRLGDRVRARVWDPIASAVGPSRDLFIVPEGATTEIPWLALPAPKGRYLAEGAYVIHVIDSERDLLPERSVLKGSGILAVGAPDFDLGGSPASTLASAAPPARPASMMVASRAQQWPCGGTEPLSLPGLPASRAEVEDIAREWPAADGMPRVLTGSAADEASVKREAPGHVVLHIATHGIVVEDTCGVAAAGSRGVGGVTEVGAAKPRARAPKTPNANVTGATRKESPWSDRQVWLALAGANRPPSNTADENEGLLTAEEIVTLDLRGTDWVVLSACHSGLATAWGREGVLGMRRAFRLAGARAVIASQWSIGDESTREWMASLYAVRTRGLAAGAAVGDACRAVLAQRRHHGRSTHPFYWAAFTASGE
jgi:CHAT domain-containing protein/tetratricopeptide (TPR) repeat protein